MSTDSSRKRSLEVEPNDEEADEPPKQKRKEYEAEQENKNNHDGYSTPSTQDPNDLPESAVASQPPPLEPATQIDVKSSSSSSSSSASSSAAVSSSSSSSSSTAVAQSKENTEDRLLRLVRSVSDVVSSWSAKSFHATYDWDDEQRLYAFSTSMYMTMVWPEFMVSGLSKDVAIAFLRSVWVSLKTGKINPSKRWIEHDKFQKEKHGVDFNFEVKMVFNTKLIRPEEFDHILQETPTSSTGFGFAYQLLLDVKDVPNGQTLFE